MRIFKFNGNKEEMFKALRPAVIQYMGQGFCEMYDYVSEDYKKFEEAYGCRGMIVMDMHDIHLKIKNKYVKTNDSRLKMKFSEMLAEELQISILELFYEHVYKVYEMKLDEITGEGKRSKYFSLCDEVADMFYAKHSAELEYYILK